MADMALTMVLRARDEFHSVMERFAADAEGVRGKIGMLAIGIGELSGGVIADTVKQAVDFQTTLNEVGNNTTMSNAQITQMGNAIKALAEQTGAPIDQLAQGWKHVTDLMGPGTANATEVVKVASEAAVSMGSNVGDTAQVLANVMHEYGMKTNEAGRAMGVLVQGARMGGMTLSQLVEGGGKAIGMAANLGVGLNDVVAAISSLTRHGYDAATASTQLIGMMEHLTNPTKAAQEQIAYLSQKTGIDLVDDFTQAGLHARTLTGVMADLMDAAHGNSSEIEKLIPALRGGLGAMTETGTAAKDLRDTYAALGEISNGNLNPTAQMFARTQQTVANEMARLRETVIVTAIDLGQSFLPMLQQVVREVAPVIKSIADWVQHHRELSARILEAVTVLGIFGGILMVVVPIIAALLSPIGLIIIAVVALAAGLVLLVTHFQQVREWLENLGKIALDAGRKLVEGLVQGIENAAEGAVSAVKGVVSKIASFLPLHSPAEQGPLSRTPDFRYIAQALLDAMPDHVAAASAVATAMAYNQRLMVMNWERTQERFWQLWNQMQDDAQMMWQNLDAIWRGIDADAVVIWDQIWADINSIAGGLGSTVVGELQQLPAQVQQSLQQTQQAIQNGMSAIAGALQDPFTAMGQWAPQVQAAASAVQSQLQNMVGGAENVLGPLATWLGNLFGGVGSAWQNAMTALGQLLQNAWTTMQSNAQTVLGALQNLVNAEWTLVPGDWAPTWQNIAGVLQNIWQSIFGNAQNILGGLLNFLNDEWVVVPGSWAPTWQQIQGTLDNIWNGIKADAQNILGGLNPILNNVWGPISSGWSNFWGTVRTTIDGIWQGIVSDIPSILGQVQPSLNGVWGPINPNWTNFWNGLKGTLDGIWQGIVGDISSVLSGPAQSALNDTWGPLHPNWQNFWAGIKSMLDTSWAALVADASSILVDPLDATLNGAWGHLLPDWQNYWDQVKAMLHTAWTDLSSTAEDIFRGIKATVGNVWDSIDPHWSDQWTTIKSDITGAWNAVKSKAEDIFRGLKADVGNAWDAIDPHWTQQWATIKAAISKAWDDIKSAASVLDHLQVHINGLWGNTGPNWNKDWIWARNQMQTLWALVSSDAQAIFPDLQNYVNTIWDVVPGNWDNRWNKSIIPRLQQLLDHAVSTAHDYGEKFIDAFGKAWQTTMNAEEGKYFLPGIQMLFSWLDDNLIGPAWQRGKSFVDNFFKGIHDAWNGGLSDFKHLLQQLSDLLPHSPAKEGPLSQLPDFTYIADQINRAVPQVQQAGSALALAAAGGAVAPGASTMGAASGAAAGAGGVVIQSGAIQIQGGVFTDQRSIDLLAQQIGDSITRQTRLQGRVLLTQ